MKRGLILVTGSEGLVGSRFVELFPRKSFLHYPRQIEFDITDKSQVKALVASYNFSAVVNFAAYTDVGEAEKQRGDKEADCWQANVEGVRNLVEAINPHKIHFIQISTDLVFAGSDDDPGPYLENHPPEMDSEKLTWYGYTKAEAERVVVDVLGNNASILRLIYPVRAKFERKLDYLRKALELFDRDKLYPVFTDQQVSIAYVDEVCKALENIIFDHHKGTFHASSKDTTTPFELISYMLEETRGAAGKVKQVTSEEFIKKGNDPRRYPKYGGLSVDITEHKLGMRFSSWRAIVDELVSQDLGQ